MILYLSGNFPQLSSPEKEKEFRDKLHAKGLPYNRLVTIFYPKHAETVLNLMREGETNESCSE